MRAIRTQRHDATDRPFIVIWEATRACALACRHCRASAIPRRDPGELSTAEARTLMEQIAAFGSPPPLFVITGGDPNFVYDAGEFVPSRTTEAHHFRRVVIQREILERHGTDHVTALGLGPLYRELRRRLTELNLPARRNRRPPMDVNAARGFIFVSHTGTAHPSGFLPEAAGNVRRTPITDIYRESSLFTGLRDPARLGGRCDACEFRTLCGGSRSRAFALTGDPHAEEPWCSYRPGSFPHQEELAVGYSTRTPFQKATWSRISCAASEGCG